MELSDVKIRLVNQDGKLKGLRPLLLTVVLPCTTSKS